MDIFLTAWQCLNLLKDGANVTWCVDEKKFKLREVLVSFKSISPPDLMLILFGHNPYLSVLTNFSIACMQCVSLICLLPINIWTYVYENIYIYASEWNLRLSSNQHNVNYFENLFSILCCFDL